MIKRYIIIFSFILYSSVVASQSITPWVNYTVNDGLPTSEIYYLIQDSKGFMWFATDRGIVRFDGNEFKVFTTDNGLTNNVVFEIFEDV